MFIRVSFRAFLVGLFVLSSLWVLVTFLPLLKAFAFPRSDIQQIVQALELRGSAPPSAESAVREAVASAGPLRRAVQVGFYSGVSVTIRANDSHTSKKTQASYIAWFEKIPKPILLLITRSEIDGVLQDYRLGEGQPMSLVGGYAFPLVMFGLSLYMLRRKMAPTPSKSLS